MKRILIAAAICSAISTPASALCTYIGATTICQDNGYYQEAPNARAYQQAPAPYTSPSDMPYSGRVNRNLPYGLPLHSCHYGVCE